MAITCSHRAWRMRRRRRTEPRPQVPRARAIAAAEAMGTSEGAVKVAVHRLRVRFGALLRAEIRQTVVDPEDVDDEIQHLLGVIGRPKAT